MSGAAMRCTPATKAWAHSPARRLRAAWWTATSEDAQAASRVIDPALMPLIIIAGAIVTEAGGSASHSSLIARELGVPAVVNTGVATQVLREGQVVEVDGTRGIVTLDG